LMAMASTAMSPPRAAIPIIVVLPYDFERLMPIFLT